LASLTYIEMLGVADKDVSAACAHERVAPASKRALDVNVPVIKLVMLNVLALRWEVKKIESANDMDLINNVLFFLHCNSFFIMALAFDRKAKRCASIVDTKAYDYV